ncbi:hypothetical protein K439DRAFT_1615657 [Ramaria rubella]|nr:hypothetical protein K439DRAFT_1615657 [Ramaria rubella]
MLEINSLQCWLTTTQNVILPEVFPEIDVARGIVTSTVFCGRYFYVVHWKSLKPISARCWIWTRSPSGHRETSERMVIMDAGKLETQVHSVGLRDNGKNLVVGCPSNVNGSMGAVWLEISGVDVYVKFLFKFEKGPKIHPSFKLSQKRCLTLSAVERESSGSNEENKRPRRDLEIDQPRLSPLTAISVESEDKNEESSGDESSYSARNAAIDTEITADKKELEKLTQKSKILQKVAIRDQLKAQIAVAELLCKHLQKTRAPPESDLDPRIHENTDDQGSDDDTAHTQSFSERSSQLETDILSLGNKLARLTEKKIYLEKKAKQKQLRAEIQVLKDQCHDMANAIATPGALERATRSSGSQESTS